MQWQPLVLPSYRGDSRAVFVVGPAGRPDHEHSADTVDTVVCAPDDGWRYHPKHVEQFPDKINCVTLHLVGYILEYYYVFYTFATECPIMILTNCNA